MVCFNLDVLLQVCDEDVGFSASVLSTHAGKCFLVCFLWAMGRRLLLCNHRGKPFCFTQSISFSFPLSDSICRLLPQHGRAKLLQLVKDVYHRFHVLHCSSGRRPIECSIALLPHTTIATFIDNLLISQTHLGMPLLLTRRVTRPEPCPNDFFLFSCNFLPQALMQRLSTLEEENAVLKGSVRYTQPRSQLHSTFSCTSQHAVETL